MDKIFLNGFPDFTTTVEEALRTIPYDTFNFSGGEVHVKIKGTPQSDKITIFARANNSDDIMRILITNDALKRLEYKKINLFMPYVPYARQDRVMVDGEAFSLKVFSNLINSCEFNKVIVFDIHSEISTVLLNNCNVISNDYFVYTCLHKIYGSEVNKFKSNNALKLISPDSGSYKKVFKLSDFLKTSVSVTSDIVTCNKARNLDTGKITSFKVDVDNLNHSECILVDDICARGGTFIGIAKALKNKNAGKIYLIVSHYEGVAEISELKSSGIEKIFTTPSIGKLDDRRNYYGDYVQDIKFEEFINFNEKPFI